MIKRVHSIILVLGIMLALSACGGGGKSVGGTALPDVPADGESAA